MKNALKSTTSLVVSLALMAPAAMAQDVTTDALTFPCVTPGGAEVADVNALAAALMNESAGAGESAASDAPACVIPPDIAAMVNDANAPADTDEAISEEAATAEADADTPAAVEEVVPEADVAAEADADVAAEESPAPDAEVVEAPATEAAPADDAPVAEMPAEAAPVEVAPVAEAPVDSEEAPVAEAPAEEAPAEEAPAADEPVAEAPAEEAPTADEPVAEAPAEEAPPADEAVAESTPEATPESEAVTSEAEAAPETAGDAIEDTTTADVDAAPADGEADIAEDTTAATDTPPATEEEVASEDEPAPQDVPAAAAAASADTAPDADADVVVEDVVEEDVRSADEDFDTAVSGNAEVTADSETADVSDRDSGLSTFEKALLLGLGAAVVGSVLNNGDEVVSNSGDRVVVERNGELVVLKNDDVLLRQAGSQVATQTFSDGSTRTVINRENGEQIITIRASDGRVLRRTRVLTNGTEIQLFDDTVQPEVVDLATLPVVTPQPTQSTPLNDQAALRAALTAALAADANRAFSLNQVRDIREVRALAPQVELDTITFATGSAAIDPSQAEQLASLGQVIRDIIIDTPSAVFLIEGHTDTVGNAGSNLSLSDRRAETVALALTQYFGVPPENLVTQGYGEADLKINQEGDIRENRRAAVRNITALLRS